MFTKIGVDLTELDLEPIADVVEVKGKQVEDSILF